ncbi:heat shock 70 kDa protein 4 isoform X2 [Onthophagus taurus]|uniref:heat shock 70 kDa protein 4 isoform X2 n=1 Tax=Onthophagus taurus TaxID=166361 RepID=UPI000C20148C|nr:heat shock 70 kDa protein 4 isoform X2 [Onthophagus taurus]
MAAMSVIGIDFGNESCYVAVAKAGGIETIANDYSLRATPTCIAFSEKNRILGVAAKNQQVTNMRNTIYGLKRLLGRKYSDKQVQDELKHLPFNTKQLPDDVLGIETRYLNEVRVFTPEQCLAMLFTKLKDTSSAAIETALKDCVISVPSYYTHAERQALLDAAAIADLNVLCLLNETTATALAYGIYKQDLPAPEETPRNVIFVDCGYASLQVSACAFHKGQLKMLAATSDPNLGGRDIDYKLAEYFKRDFMKRYGIDAGSNQRAYIRLLAEVEKLKKQMSANSTSLPLNIECFMEDKDVRGDMKRADMEELCKDLFNRVRNKLVKCLQDSGLDLEMVHSVEIVGGSTRIPAIKQLITEVFGRTPSTTLNQDEAVSRGCALQCAILSPAVRVKDFKVEDVQNYSIMLKSGPDEVHELFPKYTKVPITRKLTINRNDSFAISAYYSEEEDIHFKSKTIGTWHVKDVKQIAEGRNQPVKITFNTNQSGIFSLRKAVIECTEIVDNSEQPQQPMEVDGQNADQNGGDKASVEANSTPENGDEKKKKKTVKKDLVLTVESEIYGLSHKQIEELKEEEYKLIANDKREKERADARNALEEYVYELRGKLSSEEDLAAFIIENERTKLVNDLESMENWLYEEGEDCEKQQYKDRLVALKKRGEPVEKRKLEAERRPMMLDKIGGALQHCRKVYEGIISGKDERASHFTREELQKVEKAFGDLDEYMRKVYHEHTNLQKHVDPSITVDDMQKTLVGFRSQVDPILNKPMPKAPTPPKETKPADVNHTDGQQQQNHDAPEETEMNVDG